MSKRPPSAPPALPGFEHVRLLGSGGFADVFLYQQLHPRRQVAVKVLLKERMGTETAEGFTEEANLMAQLATHPSIVSVYEAGVSHDGRPYLVMEYCSKPNLQVRHRKEKFSVAETLRTGIQIAGAVETAHRGGILHRDIKPANVLVTDYGRPALTDFGISATTGSEFTGMSVPWSPPESFRMPPQGYPSSDVYSLAATLYTLLTNRSPFEVAGASNGEIDVISRIQASALPATGRSDVSPSFEAVLAKAMAKAPGERYQSAMEFARALQRVQIELGMQATQIDVVEEDLTHEDEDDDEGATRFRGVTSIAAQAAPPLTVPTAPAVPLDDSTIQRPAPSVAVSPAAGPAVPVAPPLDDTVARPAPPASAAVTTAPTRSRRGRTVAWVAGAAVVVVAAVVAIAITVAPTREPSAVASSKPPAPVDAIDDSGVVPQIDDLVGVAEGADVVFTWTNPAPQDGDVYKWRPVVPGEDFTFEDATTERAAVTADASGRACIEVLLVRENGRSAAEGVEGCGP